MSAEAINLARRGGNVRRYHVLPLIGEQTNAAHTFHMLVLLDQFLPEVSERLWRAVLYHDVAEYVTGDTPWAAKQRSPALAEELAKLEEETLVSCNLPSTWNLSEPEYGWFRLADSLECCYFALDQARLGNHDTATHVFWNAHNTALQVHETLQPDAAEGNPVLVAMGALRADAFRLRLTPPNA
jgi:5'-deoxynucleotidase YfbR-like HD superfamily hydrolase